ncbi:MAG: hypothetical protein ACRD12_01105 [Acidimicrobiales bacterium]
MVAVLVSGAVVSVLTGLYPGLVLFAVALGLAVGQRGKLARAIRTPDSNRRRRRFVIAAVLAIVSAASYASFVLLIGEEWTFRETLLAAVGTPAMVGAPLFLIVALLTPKSPKHRSAPATS